MDNLKKIKEIKIDMMTEMVPLLSLDDEVAMDQEKIPEEIDVLPLRNNVLYPGLILPITVAREKSLNLIKNAYEKKLPVGVFAQKDKQQEDPEGKDLYSVGILAQIIKVLKLPDGSMTAIIQGKKRVEAMEYVQHEPYMRARVKDYRDRRKPKSKMEVTDAVIDSLRDLFLQFVKTSMLQPQESFIIENTESPNFLVYFMASLLEISIQDKQEILEIRSLEERAYRVMAHISEEIKVIELRKQIQNKVKVDMDKQQRDFILNQQLKTIQEELGENDDADMDELEAKAAQKKWTPEVKEVFDKELKKLGRIHPMAPDYSVQINYLNTLVDLPWGEYTSDKFDLSKVRKVLDQDHFGLEKIKERIVEYLAVLKLRNDMKAPILCLYGPPGVGKTSLGRSIARAMGRKYVRVSLGGLRDESEIRGHRKTYIGAMPGRIVQNLIKVKTSNPVFMLDEIDKVSGMGVQGDPSAALLEVLDPEQNTTFHDNYIDVDYDLSKVLFIATANSIAEIHPALYDRMEAIEVPGYIEEEKLQIAKRHLVPKQLKEHGLSKSQFRISDKMILYLIQNYTRESGVRQLEKKIASLIRYRAKEIVDAQKNVEMTVNVPYIKAALGTELHNHSARLKQSSVGVVTGMAWTPVGGEILFIEASLSKGKGNLTLTGNLGDVMQESATLAFEYIKSNCVRLGISEDVFEKTNVHIHVPEGATPKDGPSAGVAMFTVLMSVFLNKKVKADVAMTGEITLRGQVLAVGGIREKILAAKRSGIKTIILCEENRPQIEEIPSVYLENLEILYISKMEEVLPIVLE